MEGGLIYDHCYCTWPHPQPLAFLPFVATIRRNNKPRVRRPKRSHRYIPPEGQLSFIFFLSAPQKIEPTVNADELPDLQSEDIPMDACKFLVEAVLVDGLRQVSCGNELDREWMYDDCNDPFSFTWCCDRLGFDAEVLREKYEASPQVLKRIGRGRTRKL